MMKNPTKPTMRPATMEDAQNLAKLIDIAGEGIPNWLWSKSSDAQHTPLDIGTQRARRPSGGFSYTNAFVADIEGNIAGMLLGYPITQAPDDDPDDLPAPIAPFVELEKHSVATWYVNALAVFAEHHGKGIGSALMALAEDEARKAAMSKMSIQVYGQNHGAVRLYRRLGYQLAEKAPVRLHPCQPFYTGDVLLLIKAL
ncbi:MAG: GNAT family N-acetyltransferase [Pseudomonadota bacterium]